MAEHGEGYQCALAEGHTGRHVPSFAYKCGWRTYGCEKQFKSQPARAVHEMFFCEFAE